MAKLWAVVKREYMERVRTKWFIIGSVLGPVLFAAMLVGPAYLSLRSRASRDVNRITILDATGAGLGERVRRALATPRDSAGPAAPAATPAVAPPAEARVRTVPAAELAQAESLATADVMRGESRGYLVLTAATLAGDSARYAGRNASSLRDVERLRLVVRQEVLAHRLRAAGLDSARVASLTGPRLALGAERITDQGRGGSGTAAAIFAGGTAVLLYFAIFLYGQNVLRSVIEEKTTRVAEVVVSSVRPETLLAGKVIGVGAVGLTQQLFWIVGTVYLSAQLAPMLARMAAEERAAAGGGTVGAASAAAFSLPSVSPGTIALLLLFFVLGYGFYSSLFAAVGSTVNSDQEAQQATAPILVLLIGTSLVIQPVMFDPTSTLARTMSLVPVSSPIVMPLRMGLGGVPGWEIALSLALLALSCWAAIWVSARIYRTGMLMYGKRPTVREMVRWVGRAG